MIQRSAQVMPTLDPDMGERLKDEHRKPRPAPGEEAKVKLAVVVETPPPVQPVPHQAPPLWVPWALHH